MHNFFRVGLIVVGIWIGYKIGTEQGVAKYRNNWNIYGDLRGRSETRVTESQIVGAIIGGIVGLIVSLGIHASPAPEPTSAGPKKPLEDHDPV